MFKYFLKRFGLMLITFLIVVFLFFMFIHLLPDFKNSGFGEDDLAWKQEIIKRKLNEPIPVQFIFWIYYIFKDGTFGFSTVHRLDVSVVLFSKIPITVMFQLIPYLITVPLGIFLGIQAALHKNKFADNLISILIMIFISVPVFIVAVLCQFIFAWKLRIFPIPPFVATAQEFQDNFWFGIYTYILPSIVMILSGIPGWARSIRAELTEQLTQDYMLLARSKGLSKSQATYRHALKNAIVPFAPSIFLGFLGLMSGSIILEKIFRVGGIGDIYLNAFNNRDFSLLLLNMVFFQFIGLVTGILADLSYTILDPRVRVGSAKS